MNNHEHRFDPFQVKNSFEPTGNVDELGNILYIMVEYAFSACKCGEAQKKRVATK